MTTQSSDKSAPKGTTNQKEQIIALYLAGMHDIEDLAMVTRGRPSYIASVLRGAGLEQSYFDLYTSNHHPMNVYSKFFVEKLGFKDPETAQKSIDHIDTMYHQFELGRDRAGQHHTMMMAMTMSNRAQWTGKLEEAAMFREWIRDRFQEQDDWEVESEEE